VDTQALDTLVSVEKEFGVRRALLICHSLGAKQYAESRFPGRFIFAKYFSGAARFVDGVDPILKEIRTMKEEGYHLGKMQSAPIMRARARADLESLRMDEEEMARMLDALKDEGFPFLLHLSDPDTYYAKKYTDSTQFSSKERDLAELEGVISRHKDLRLQIAHFAAQPEIHRLDHLSRWFDRYENFNIDTSSARWMARELGKDPRKARDFFIKYADRIHFGTDCVAFNPDRSYYEGRHLALRLLFETGIRQEPLPFPDADTADSGGTFINGLELPEDVLRKIYWENATSFYQLDS
jgi:predicted TIM-barrel fold metal-dependent hydrolase